MLYNNIHTHIFIMCLCVKLNPRLSHHRLFLQITESTTTVYTLFCCLNSKSTVLVDICHSLASFSLCSSFSFPLFHPSSIDCPPLPPSHAPTSVQVKGLRLNVDGNLHFVFFGCYSTTFSFQAFLEPGSFFPPP